VFTGLIEEVGTVVAMRASDNGTKLEIAAPRAAREMHPGDSIAVNGCCLTLLRQDSRLNLERALRADGRLGGHFVQGHVDCVSRIIAFDRKGADFRLEVELPESSGHYVVSKGSIAVDGISLTVAEVLPGSFAVWIIPHTRRHTNLDRATTGDLVNLEFDILAKYVERMVAPSVTKE